MSTSSPTDIPQPAEPTGGDTTAVESSATIALTKVEEDTKASAPTWTPRPHEQLSPEDKDLTDLTDEELEALTADGAASKGILGGAAAITGAALGLASITGTWLGTLIFDRQQLVGNIAASGKTAAVMLQQEYTNPWHKMAEFNGIFAVVAVIVAIGVLFAGKFLAAKPLPTWIQAVAWAALALGVIGLFISGAMYFDWFTTAIKVPAAAATSTTGG
ncbi:hypothetical protein ABIA33_003883 [Streptacidiphilus sp. MAP12-16]|uniref:hypothetical protein n=1 Tax=Streptacidiphilus sp. MAP12-16 TaxID=3156300 RepID=UPI00351820DA